MNGLSVVTGAGGFIGGHMVRALVDRGAADMGGMGFIQNNKALCMLSVLINTHLLMGAREAGVGRFFFASSACVHAAGRQPTPEVTPLREGDAYPAMLEDGYGWEKLLGVRGRNSDNTMILAKLGWQPSTSLEVGLRKTYEWIHAEMTAGRPDSAFLNEPAAEGAPARAP